MNLIKDIPYFKSNEIRSAFQARITPDMTDEAKDTLQAEYNTALILGQKAVDLEAEAVRKANTDAFLANPKAVLEEIDKTKMQGYSIGETMLMYGIGTVSSKRHGKGFMIGKKTLGQHTVSQFTVTAVIGPHKLTEECGSDNDKRCKESMHAMVLENLARNIASKGTPQ